MPREGGARGLAAIAEILAEAKAGLHELYGPRLRHVLLFGSYARGEAQPDSDIDLAVVLDDFATRAAELKRMSSLLSRISYEHDTLVGSIPIRAREWEAPEEPVVLSIRREGVAL